MNIAPIVRHLLIHNEKAVIPGFGTFIIQQRPAQLNKLTHVLTPPIREIRFDSGQQTDDMQLLNFLTKQRKQSKAASEIAIREFSKALSDQLIHEGKVSVEGIGKISLTQSGEMKFKASEELHKLTGIFELPKISIPLSQPETKAAVVKETMPERPVIRVKKRNRWWIPAAIFVVLAGLSAVGYFTGMMDSLIKTRNSATTGIASDDRADKLIFGSRDETSSKQSEPDTLREKISRELDKRTSRENALAYDEVQATPEPETQRNHSTSDSETVSGVSAGKPYHIIAGAFLVPNNAERQKRLLEKQGLSPLLLPKRGDYFMVSLGAYDTQEQATASMRHFRNKLEQELWVLKL